MSLIGRFIPTGPSGFGHRSTAEEVLQDLDLTGKVFLITGVNSGLGLESARVLSAKGATLIGLARTVEKAQQAFDSIGAKDVHCVACDLSEPKQLQQAILDINALNISLDALIANAGIMAMPALQTKYDLELHFLTNHIGHFILVTGLLDSLTENGRIVMLSSRAHEQTYRGGIQFDNLDGSKGYTRWLAYGQSKLCNLLFAKELANRLTDNRTAYSLHPGVIPTNIMRNLPSFLQTTTSAIQSIFLKTIPEGAATQVYAAAHPDLVGKSGDYFVDCNVGKPSKYAKDAALASRLWTESEAIVERLLRA